MLSVLKTRGVIFKTVCSYDLMLTCYLVSNCGHSICGTCQSRQDDQSATRCPVCNTTLQCYIPNIALRNAARAQRCTCKFCQRQLVAEDVATHEQECGEIPLQCATCSEKIARKHIKDHVCPNELVNCSCGASVRRKEMERHQAQLCPCLSTSCPLACGLDLAR